MLKTFLDGIQERPNEWKFCVAIFALGVLLMSIGMPKIAPMYFIVGLLAIACALAIWIVPSKTKKAGIIAKGATILWAIGGIGFIIKGILLILSHE